MPKAGALLQEKPQQQKACELLLRSSSHSPQLEESPHATVKTQKNQKIKKEKKILCEVIQWPHALYIEMVSLIDLSWTLGA